MSKILWFSSLLEGNLPSSKDENHSILLNQALFLSLVTSKLWLSVSLYERRYFVLLLYIFASLKVMGVLTYYLVAYPEIQEKLQDEVDDLFDSKNEGDELQAEDLNNMKYLDQVILITDFMIGL